MDVDEPLFGDVPLSDPVPPGGGEAGIEPGFMLGLGDEFGLGTQEMDRVPNSRFGSVVPQTPIRHTASYIYISIYC